MISERLTRSYAEALFGAAEEKNKVDEVAKDLKGVLEIIFEAEFREFFLSPSIDPEKKKRLFAKAFDEVNVLVRNFFWLIFDNKREELLLPVGDEFERLVDEHRRRIVASVTSAIELPSELANMLRLRLEESLGKEVILKPAVDPDLKGGFVLKVGDRVIDVSLKARVAEIRRRMVGYG
ncbi:MAG: ATP synthase F1 subunit delta [Candidatus Aquicultorales bacterium]